MTVTVCRPRFPTHTIPNSYHSASSKLGGSDGLPGLPCLAAAPRDHALGKAHCAFRCADRFNGVLDLKKAQEFSDETEPHHHVARCCSICGPNGCAMKTARDEREYAEQQGVGEQAARAQGMAEKVAEFRAQRSEIDRPA